MTNTDLPRRLLDFANALVGAHGAYVDRGKLAQLLRDAAAALASPHVPSRPEVITQLLAVDDTGTLAHYIRKLEAARAASPSRTPADEPGTSDALGAAVTELLAEIAYLRAERDKSLMVLTHELDEAIARAVAAEAARDEA